MSGVVEHTGAAFVSRAAMTAGRGLGLVVAALRVRDIGEARLRAVQTRKKRGRGHVGRGFETI